MKISGGQVRLLSSNMVCLFWLIKLYHLKFASL